MEPAPDNPPSKSWDYSSSPQPGWSPRLRWILLWSLAIWIIVALFFGALVP